MAEEEVKKLAKSWEAKQTLKGSSSYASQLLPGECVAIDYSLYFIYYIFYLVSLISLSGCVR